MSRNLNRRLTLEALSATPDGAGGQAEHWSAVATHFADVRSYSGREREVGGRASARVTHKALIRHVAFGAPTRPRPDQRFREGDRIFAIRAVAEADDRRGYLLCWLEEGALS